MPFLLAFVLALLPVFAHAEDTTTTTTTSSSNAGFFATLWSYLDRLFQAIEAFIKWLSDLVTQVFVALFTLLQDVVYFALATLLKFAGNLIKTASDSLGISQLASTIAGYWSMVPPEVQGILQAIGIPTAFAIIVTGIIIRFVLQLIPFIRLGS